MPSEQAWDFRTLMNGQRLELPRNFSVQRDLLDFVHYIRSGGTHSAETWKFHKDGEIERLVKHLDRRRVWITSNICN